MQIWMTIKNLKAVKLKENYNNILIFKYSLEF